MLYEQFCPITELISVDRMEWKGGTFNIAPRNLSALAFRIRGEAVIITDRSRKDVRPNEILYLPQNVAYTAHYTDTEMLVIHFRTLKDDKDAEVYTLQNTEKIYHGFLKMHALWQEKQPGNDLEVAATFYEILAEIRRENTSEKMRPEFLKCISYVNANFKNPDLSVPEICRQTGIGETTFRQWMNTYYRKTPIEYITKLRLEYARNRISCGASVESAACESGFRDPKYFSRTVKKHFGCTPKDWKTFGK